MNRVKKLDSDNEDIKNLQKLYQQISLLYNKQDLDTFLYMMGSYIQHKVIPDFNEQTTDIKNVFMKFYTLGRKLLMI